MLLVVVVVVRPTMLVGEVIVVVGVVGVGVVVCSRCGCCCRRHPTSRKIGFHIHPSYLLRDAQRQFDAIPQFSPARNRRPSPSMRAFGSTACSTCSPPARAIDEAYLIKTGRVK